MIQLRWSAVGTAALTLLISACSASSAAGPTSTSSTIDPTPNIETSAPVITDPTTTTSTSTTSTTVPPTTTPTVPALKVPLDHVVKMGEHSDAVAYIQDRLIKLGFDPGPLDGSFGTVVQEAVWAFQELQGLDGKDVNGQVIRVSEARSPKDRERPRA